MAPFLWDMSAEQFGYVESFLQDDDYHPRLLNAGTDYATIESHLPSNELVEHIQICMQLDDMAQRLERGKLRLLVAEKLGVLLAYAEPAMVDSILAALPDRIATARQELQDVIADFIADRLLIMMENSNERLVALFEHDPTLKRAVFARAAETSVGTKEDTDRRSGAIARSSYQRGTKIKMKKEDEDGEGTHTERRFLHLRHALNADETDDGLLQEALRRSMTERQLIRETIGVVNLVIDSLDLCNLGKLCMHRWQ